MNMTSRLGLISVSLVAVATLTACQSTTNPHGKPEKQQRGNHDGQYQSGQHREHHDRNMTPEQKQQWKQQSAARKQLFKDMRQACDGKALGQSVQLKAGDQTVSGQCQMSFKADQQAKGKYRDHDMQRGMQGQKHRDMTPEQRQQAQVQFQFQAKREQRQAQWTAVQKACEGQAQGKAIQVKMGEKEIKGQCMMTFKPDLDQLKTALKPNAV